MTEKNNLLTAGIETSTQLAARTLKLRLTFGEEQATSAAIAHTCPVYLLRDSPMPSMSVSPRRAVAIALGRSPNGLRKRRITGFFL